MGDAFEYLAYAVNIGSKKDKYRRSYEIFGDICSEIKFTEACSSKISISLSRVDILRIEAVGMEKTC